MRVRVRHEYHSKTPAYTYGADAADAYSTSSEVCASSIRGEMRTSSSARPTIGSGCREAYSRNLVIFQ